MHQPIIRPMLQSDLDVADRVHRIAFGTRFGLPDPVKFRGDAQLVRNRWAIDATTSLVAEADGVIVGGACAMDWGSVFIVGPVFVLPDQAGRGIARLLMDRMIVLADERGAKLAGLFTFPESATHLRLYESFGFAPQALTPIMTKAPGSGAQRAHVLFSKLPAPARERALEQCRDVTDAMFPGLDLAREIAAIATLDLGDTILLGSAGEVRGLALCHSGAGSEGGSATVFVKFAAVRPRAPEDFAHLLDCCEEYALVVGAERVAAGTNTARSRAYRIMRERGFRAGLIGVAMHRPDGPGYNQPDVFAIDDWR
jgi:predicted N-acetyltransferase YhbS